MKLSPADKKKLIEPANEKISIARQCRLLGICRAAYYYEPREKNREQELLLMNRIDEIYTEFPFYGSPKITAELQKRGHIINHKVVERLMREMGLSALIPKKKTSIPHPAHYKYPYLLNGLDIKYPNHVWGTDITYVRAHGVWFYLVAIIDWFSRYVLAWKLSPTLSASFCSEALQNALLLARPEIHNSDQGSQFTSEEYTKILKEKNIQISMDGRGRCFDNIFTERLWRTVKYEEVYLHDYESYREAEISINNYFQSYNYRRLHQAIGYKTPAEIYYQK